MLNTCKLDSHLSEHILLMQSLLKQKHEINALVDAVTSCISNGGTVFTLGNGGSASDAQHFSGELIGRFRKNRRPLKSICLNTDTSVLTCIANDFGYDEVYSRQIEALATDKDLIILISTSGTSANIVRAAKTCFDLKLPTFALTGKDGGQLLNLCSNSIVVSSLSTARIQEAHIFLIHLICEYLEDIL